MTAQVGNHTEIVTDVAHLRKSGHSLILTLPKGVVRAMDWEAGDALVFTIEGPRVVMGLLLDHMSAAISEHDKQTIARG